MPGYLHQMRSAVRQSIYGCVLVALVCLATLSVRGQDQGPMAAPPKFEVNRIPSVPHPGPPPIPVEQIIQKFAANEDMMKKVFDTYDFTQTVRVEELADAGGKFTASGEIYTKPGGGRFWRLTSQPVSNMKAV